MTWRAISVRPYGEDDHASAEVRVTLDLSLFKINDLAVGMELYCAAPVADAQKYLVGRRWLTV